MKWLTTALMIIISLTLSACVSWPILGSGGAAENSATANKMDNPSTSITPEQGLFFELELAQRHLDVMVLEGAEYCFPATVVQARTRENRIIRELHGGLELDAANDLIIQRKLLLRLEQQLDYVTREHTCTPPSDDSLWLSEKSIEKITHLLNSGQQFEDKSDVLTQKYMSQLAEASFLLRDQDSFDIYLTGHLETIGDKEQQALSLARTQMVQRYLNVFGIKSEHIHLKSIDSDNPLFEQHVAIDKNTRHRVTIELVELQSRTQNTGE